MPGVHACYSGIVNGDTAASLGGTLAFDTTATALSGVGAYAVTPKGLTSSNYDIAFGDGTLDIGQKALSVTADYDTTTAAVDHFTKTYGQANPPFTVRYSGFVNGDTAASLGGTLAFDTTPTALRRV